MKDTNTPKEISLDSLVFEIEKCFLNKGGGYFREDAKKLIKSHFQSLRDYHRIDKISDREAYLSLKKSNQALREENKRLKEVIECIPNKVLKELDHYKVVNDYLTQTPKEDETSES